MYYNKKIEEIEKELETSSQGLSKKEVETRQLKYGKNQLPRKKADSILKIFFSEFKDPMIILLLFAIIASFITGELIDVDGHCGGYNLGFAWITGMLAGRNLNDKNKTNKS